MIHHPKKRWGQHFLCDQAAILRIIHAVAPDPDQIIVEIGPGHGALTRHLLNYPNTLHVIEIDRNLAGALSVTYQNKCRLIVHCADALKYDLTLLGNHRLNIVGNLPYNISTPLIFHLLQHREQIDCMTLMLQTELVERLCAPCGNKHYGRLSVMVQARCATKKLLVIGPDAFSPPPKVTSSVVQLKPHDTLSVNIDDYQSFSKIVKCAFSHRRKTLKNSLRGLLDEHQISALGIDPKTRAETVSVTQYIELAKLLK